MCVSVSSAEGEPEEARREEARERRMSACSRSLVLRREFKGLEAEEWYDSG